VCNNAAGKSPWLPLPALGCSSAKPTSASAASRLPQNMSWHQQHRAPGTAAISVVPAEDVGLGACSPAGVCSHLQASPHITSGAAPRQAAGPGSRLDWRQQLPANTKNAQASEIWRMSTYCKKPHSSLFSHLPSPVHKRVCVPGIANEGRAERGSPSAEQWEGSRQSRGVRSPHRLQQELVKQLPWLPPKAKGSHPTPASPVWPETSAQRVSP